MSSTQTYSEQGLVQLFLETFDKMCMEEFKTQLINSVKINHIGIGIAKKDDYLAIATVVSKKHTTVKK